MKHDLARPFFQLPPERYHFTPFGSLADYVRFLGSLDVGVVPLLPTDYNRCRSDVKFLEYASRGVVGVYADLEPYRSVVAGETGLLYRTSTELIEHLERLRTDATLRNKLRTQAYEYVRTKRRLPDHVGNRLAWYRELLPGTARPTGLSQVLIDSVEAEGRYWQLRPGAPERSLLSAQEKQDPHEAAALLTAMVEREPGYLAALQKLGQTLNTQRDKHRALEVLERARTLQPRSARTLCEIGRTWYWLDDRERARAYLKEAIELEPLYLPGWQYLLRLLSLDRSADGPEWAQRADKVFPSCYSLALLGVQTYPADRCAGVLLPLLERFAESFTPEERPLTLAAFRHAIVAAVQAAPTVVEVVPLLRRACEAFPESARLASELAVALERSGQSDEAYRCHARALQLSRQARLYQEEFPREQSPQWNWQFGEYIARTQDYG